MSDPIRYVNVALSLLIALAGIPQLRSFLTRGGKDQLHWMSSVLLNLAALIGSIESLHEHLPTGIRSYVLTVGLAWLLATVLYKPTQRWRARRASKESP